MNTSVHLAHSPLSLPCASFTGPSHNLKTLVIEGDLGLLNDNSTIQQPPLLLHWRNLLWGGETQSLLKTPAFQPNPTQLNPIQPNSTQPNPTQPNSTQLNPTRPNPTFSLPPPMAPTSIRHHPDQVASCPTPSSPYSHGQEEGFTIQKRQVSLRLLQGRLGGVLDKEMPGCISSPHVWLQRQLAAGLCPPTPGKEVKPQESSKQVKA